MMRNLLVIALMMTLAACTSVDDPFLQTGALKANGPSLATSVSADYALGAVAGLPASSVRQTVREDHADQTIVYADVTDLAGENTLTVTVGKAGSARDLQRASTRSEIAAEMRSAFPGIPMRISPAIGENANGVFGYATGPMPKGGGCLYAWQLARHVTPQASVGLPRTSYAARVRLRYCSPSMPQDRIAVLVKGLRIKPVTAETFQTLRFAEGTGETAAASLFATRPAANQPAEGDVAETAPPRRVSKRAVATELVEVTSPEKAIAHAVKVPMPAVAAGLAQSGVSPAVVAEVVSGTTIVEPSIVPLPAAVAATPR